MLYALICELNCKSIKVAIYIKILLLMKTPESMEVNIVRLEPLLISAQTGKPICPPPPYPDPLEKTPANMSSLFI